MCFRNLQPALLLLGNVDLLSKGGRETRVCKQELFVFNRKVLSQMVEPDSGVRFGFLADPTQIVVLTDMVAWGRMQVSK